VLQRAHRGAPEPKLTLFAHTVQFKIDGRDAEAEALKVHVGHQAQLTNVDGVSGVGGGSGGSGGCGGDDINS